MTAVSEQELEAEFLRLSESRSAALQASEPARANTYFDRLHGLKNAMRQLPDRGDAALKRIAGNADPQVRITAAAALLAVDESFALAVLERSHKITSD